MATRKVPPTEAHDLVQNQGYVYVVAQNGGSRCAAPAAASTVSPSFNESHVTKFHRVGKGP